ncbi:hypothetical protein [Chroococcidiopsis cubana]|uniref:hypothetical protein n=1 Tax=Chroococcidiopsis cubana TaxID=171392 RepID=UPI002ACE2788|nr:hypothetical protein [Chroococcidiopsis cubana]
MLPESGARGEGDKGNSLFPRPKAVGIRGEGDKGDKGEKRAKILLTTPYTPHPTTPVASTGGTPAPHWLPYTPFITHHLLSFAPHSSPLYSHPYIPT